VGDPREGGLCLHGLGVLDLVPMQEDVPFVKGHKASAPCMGAQLGMPLESLGGARSKRGRPLPSPPEPNGPRRGPRGGEEGEGVSPPSP
jgi:hypothetical protein